MIQTESITLSPEEIFQITKRKRYAAQIRALEAMRIPVKPRIDGSPCVFRAAAKQQMGVCLTTHDPSSVHLNLDTL